MGYKDKERQKQANREASRRRRLRQQGITPDEMCTSVKMGNVAKCDFGPETKKSLFLRPIE